ncbi:methyltransferase family protein [Nesterenkonia muleiensis]|uniref:methyltransferase family protein n=1 Tax=Nesterenkonia muleiensis TaxID=2282648 RepID=UPI000E72D8BF|nr:isoprenylcysteine carboxylmethyltransferase family protein [Nesterenkonia muleiensis]
MLSRHSGSSGPLGKATAALVGAASVGTLGGSILRFRQQETTVDPVSPQRASSLVTDGPSRFTRNPMYVGMGGLLIAHAIYRSSVLAMLPAVGFVVAIDRLQIPAEEAALRNQFGEQFEQYCASVPRWLDNRSWSALR